MHMVAGYEAGAFPMDSDDDGPVGWYTTDPRCVIRVDDARIPRTVARMLRRRGYEVRVDTAFSEVLDACGGDREGVWLTPRLMRGYEALFDLGIAHSVEAWDGDRLVGGLFGVAMGRFITAESMFALIDVQMQSPHVMRFGATTMDADLFAVALSEALAG